MNKHFVFHSIIGFLGRGCLANSLTEQKCSWHRSRFLRNAVDRCRCQSLSRHRSQLAYAVLAFSFPLAFAFALPFALPVTANRRLDTQFVDREQSTKLAFSLAFSLAFTAPAVAVAVDVFVVEFASLAFGN